MRSPTLLLVVGTSRLTCPYTPRLFLITILCVRVCAEAEFRAYHLLSLMGQHGKFKGDQQGFLSMLQAMRPEVRGAPPIQWVLQLQARTTGCSFVCRLASAGLCIGCSPRFLATRAGEGLASTSGLLSQALRPRPRLPAARLCLQQLCALLLARAARALPAGLPLTHLLWPGGWLGGCAQLEHGQGWQWSGRPKHHQTRPRDPGSQSSVRPSQVRGRALRTLGDTLAPKADTPVALELSWLVVSVGRCSQPG